MSTVPRLRLVTEPVDQAEELRGAEAIADGIFTQCRSIAERIGLIVEGDGSIRNACVETAVFANAGIVTTYRGGTGTGKDLFPRLYHELAARSGRQGHFMQINLAALSETLIESELFGHKKGAFTGATADRPSVFEQAVGGTVHLDEIGLLPKHLQGKLLRVIGNREVKAVGSNAAKAVDCNIVCSTNKQLEDMVEKGEFLEDLYHRITGGQIVLPEWHFRQESHRRAILASFLKEVDAKMDAKSEELLLGMKPRGNVREIELLVRRAAAFLLLRPSDDRVIRVREIENALASGGKLRPLMEIAGK